MATPSDAELLDAALNAFAERGFHGTSVREVARAAGVSHNTIPKRYGSKEQLWFRAVDHGFAAISAELLAVSDDMPTDDVERLRTIVTRFVEANARRPAMLRIINQEAVSPGPRLDYLFDTYIEPVGRAGAAILRALHSEGRVRTDSATLLYFFMTHGAGGPLALPALAERFGETVDPAEAVALLFEGLARE